jgi:hypothetical protein
MVSRKTYSLATLLCISFSHKKARQEHKKTKVDNNHTTTKMKADLYPHSRLLRDAATTHHFCLVVEGGGGGGN